MSSEREVFFKKSHLFHTEPQNKSYLVWFQVTAAQERDFFFLVLVETCMVWFTALC